MSLQLLTQPYRNGPSALSFLEVALSDERVVSLVVITAWVRRSGLDLLVPALETLRVRGGTATLVVGVDLDGTTRQGMELARQHFNKVYVFHDPAGGTFHPKLYLATSATKSGYALIGSSNLTAGGMWHNYEAGVLATLSTQADAQFAEQMQTYAAQLIADTAACKRVTPAVLRRLVDEGWIADESRGARRREDRPGAGRRPATAGKTPLFSASTAEKRTRPPQRTASASASKLNATSRARTAIAPDSWFKQLGAGEAQQLEQGHVTGNIALTNVPKNQDRARFFRDTFFAGENWRVDPIDPDTEIAEVQAVVEVGRRQLGTHRLELVFREYRSERGRATTVVRLDADVRAQMRASRVTGWYLLIERRGLGAYRLRVLSRRPA